MDDVAMGLILSGFFGSSCQYHFTAAPFTHIYHLGDGQWARLRLSSTHTVSFHCNNNNNNNSGALQDWTVFIGFNEDIGHIEMSDGMKTQRETFVIQT
jgi:hypothetical protein